LISAARRPAGAAAGTLLLLAAGCFGRGIEPKRPGSAIWLSSESGELTKAEQGDLAMGGLAELFLEVGELRWEGLPAIARQRFAKVPPRMPATLAVRGVWTPGELDPLAVAEALEKEFQAARIEAEQKGLLVVGFHLDVDSGSRAEHLAKTVAALHRKLRGRAYLSIGFERRALAEEGAKEIAEGADFVTSFVYGQKPGEAEDPQAWDLQEVEKTFHRLEALGKPYLTGAITVGSGTYLAGGKTPERVTTRLSLAELVADRRLELRPGFSLQGVDRQLFEFAATEATKVGDLTLRRGDAVRVVRTAGPLIEEFRRRVGAWDSSRRLGDLYTKCVLRR